MPTNNQVSFLPYDDYAQSASTLFHFMTKPKYLSAILLRRAIVPRYCVETIDYLNIRNDTRTFKTALTKILTRQQKIIYVLWQALYRSQLLIAPSHFQNTIFDIDSIDILADNYSA